MPTLYVVCGPPGVGKTAIATHIASECDAELLRTDVVRKELFTDPDYTTAESDTVYEELAARARAALAAGDSVVLDGTFHRRDRRDRAATIAKTADASFCLLRVTCEADTVKQRLTARTDNASDADFDVYRQLHDEFDPLERPHVTIDNSGPFAVTRQQVEAAIFTPE